MSDYYIYSGDVALSAALAQACPPADPRRKARPAGEDHDVVSAADWDAYVSSGLFSWHAAVAPDALLVRCGEERLDEAAVMAGQETTEEHCCVAVWQDQHLLAPAGGLPTGRVSDHPAETAFLLVHAMTGREDFFGFHRVARRKVKLADTWVNMVYFHAAPDEPTPLPEHMLATKDQVLRASPPALSRVLLGNFS